ncbi:uncharacterized protein PHALS_07077 [Plasmopara halstedii]|uniref:Uncharacterized protein n=1 Tax=Plasmopara halstedii TaxID=4781 RepID=A0A0N7L8A2_PLAHL|nr:uncharacterized protein PHALS_07077 [Plasmopara halstedii]CEG49307.1 hypothetical protein PHALS_07077 [Plasmopara halstedii]|eukprot:XP_024585676.1 hypothetical protein PHALS_07077 [Plasmopara halstedii]
MSGYLLWDELHSKFSQRLSLGTTRLQAIDGFICTREFPHVNDNIETQSVLTLPLGTNKR